MGAHVALQTYDILCHIFEQLSAPSNIPLESWTDVDPLRDLNLATLARSARVCRSWSDPALRVLWEQLGSIEPLLKLVIDGPPFPSDQTDLVSIQT